MRSRIGQVLTSRTAWTLAALFVIGGVQNIEPFMPSSVATMVDGVLVSLAVYFKVNPSQLYGK